MAPSNYTLRIGQSADGQTLHPSEADPEEGFTFSSLEEAQEEAERLAGRRPSWRLTTEDTSVAAVGKGRVVEITRGTAGTAIELSLGLM